MPIRRSPFFLLTAALLLFVCNCADYPVPPRTHSLDYLEFHDPSGWVLHIDGDGGGRLVCRHLPGRRVIYLPATFRLFQAARKVANCHEQRTLLSPACARAVYFNQASNVTNICHCPEESWMQVYFKLAFSEIRRSPAKLKDRRLLKRQWLQEPPMATSITQSEK